MAPWLLLVAFIAFAVSADRFFDRLAADRPVGGALLGTIASLALVIASTGWLIEIYA